MQSDASDLGIADRATAKPSVGLVIPTLNAEPWLVKLVSGIRSQTVTPDRFVVLDSMSDDSTVPYLQDAGVDLITIDRKDFDHGGTRQRGLAMLGDVEYVIFMTQDALPADDRAFEKLLEPFADGKIGMVYGRQLPREGAKPIEAHARLFNYPDISVTDDRETLRQRGIKATFCSNSFAAYRVSALREVGGFPEGCIFGEDAIVATRMLLGGWRKHYAAEAKVYHSHCYDFSKDLRRNFDVGVMHSEHGALWHQDAIPAGEGFRFVRSELLYLARHSPLLVVSSMTRTALKLIGYTLGTQHQRLPDWLIYKLTLNPGYWRKKRG